MPLIPVVGGKDAYLRDILLDHVLGSDDYTPPATVYIALYTALSEDGLTFTEASAGGYARLAVTNNLTNWPAASGGIKRNGIDFEWAEATADVGTIVGAAVYDASSGGNRLYWGPFGTGFPWLDGFEFVIPANSGVFTEH